MFKKGIIKTLNSDKKPKKKSNSSLKDSKNKISNDQFRKEYSINSKNAKKILSRINNFEYNFKNFSSEISNNKSLSKSKSKSKSKNNTSTANINVEAYFCLRNLSNYKEISNKSKLKTKIINPNIKKDSFLMNKIFDNCPKSIECDKNNNSTIFKENNKKTNIQILLNKKKIIKENIAYNIQLDKLKKILSDKKNFDNKFEKLLKNKISFKINKKINNENNSKDIIFSSNNTSKDNIFLNIKTDSIPNKEKINNENNNNNNLMWKNKENNNIFNKKYEKSCPKFNLKQFCSNLKENKNLNKLDVNNNLNNQIRVNSINSLRHNKNNYSIINTINNEKNISKINVLKKNSNYENDQNIINNEIKKNIINNTSKQNNIHKISLEIKNNKSQNSKSKNFINESNFRKKKTLKFDSDINSYFRDYTNYLINKNNNNNLSAKKMRYNKSNSNNNNNKGRNNKQKHRYGNLFKLQTFSRKNSNLAKKDQSKNNEKTENKNTDIDEKKILDNISENSITMFSIFILTKYNDNYNKIGLSKIRVLDITNNEIPIICYNSNAEYDSGKLFNTKMNNNMKKNDNNQGNNEYNCELMSEFKENIHINFYLNSKDSEDIGYIFFENYSNDNDNISYVKNIEILKGNLLIFKGKLKDVSGVSDFNIIKVINKFNDSPYFDFIKSKTLNGIKTNKNINHVNSQTSQMDIHKNSQTARSGCPYNNIPPKNTGCNTINININTNNITNTNMEIYEKLLHNNIDNNNLFFSSINDFYSNSNNKTNTNNNSENNITEFNNINYIEFNKIRLVLMSNYGHKKFIGLTGIEFYDLSGKMINIETANTIGALPKDLKTIYKDEKENRIFENVFNGINNTNDEDNMWVTKFKKTEPYTFIELCFENKIKLSKIKIYNYNQKNQLNLCTKSIDIFLDNEFYKTILLKQDFGEIAYDFLENKNISENETSNFDFGQEFLFKNNNFTNELNENITMQNNKTFCCNPKLNDKIKYASFLYEQSYEAPFIPNGICLKFEFLSNYYKGIPINNENLNKNELQYYDIGLEKIEVFNEEGNLINNYKIISNCEMFKRNKKNSIILNGAQNEDGNSCLFFLFEKDVYISYIKFYPLSEGEKLNNVKEIKIFCENKIIFEGDLYKNHPTIVLFTCDMKIAKNINEKYLTKSQNKERDFEEIYNEDYISLVLK